VSNPSGAEATEPCDPGQTIWGAEIVISGRARMFTATVFDVVHPDFVTETVSPVVSEAPAMNVMVGVPAPLVMRPLVIVHVYESAPAGTVAEFPAEPAQTAAAVVMSADGGVELIGIVRLLATVQLPLVKERSSLTFPVVPAVKVTVCPVAPAVMVPFVMVQL
jgi:hypothetical protein